MATSLQLCTFCLADQFFGVPVGEVQEVLRHQNMTHVPLAGAALRGLINLRGRIVPAIDLRNCLGITERAPEQHSMNMVVHTPEGPLSILVDEIGEVLELDQHSFESPPPTLQGKTRDMIKGVYKLPGRLLLVLDVERVSAEIVSPR